jgi:hypothetical protein
MVLVEIDVSLILAVSFLCFFGLHTFFFTDGQRKFRSHSVSDDIEYYSLIQLSVLGFKDQERIILKQNFVQLVGHQTDIK